MSREIDIYQDIIKEYFGETVDEGGGTIAYHIYPNSNVTLLVGDLYKADKQLLEAKKENRKLIKQYKWYDHYKDSALGHTKLINEKYIPQIEALTEQNKQLKETIERLIIECDDL